VAVVGGHAYALHPWIDGRHRHGGQLSTAQSARLGALLGAVHACLEAVMPPKGRTRPATSPHPVESADPADTFALIDELLGHVQRHRPCDAFDTLARHRLLERRTLLEQHADRRPPLLDLGSRRPGVRRHVEAVPAPLEEFRSRSRAGDHSCRRCR
ncbi:hypothetical protein AB0I83_15060, partial [Streptomyces sp. NPDC049970]